MIPASRSDTTRYSDEVPGEPRNHHLAARFDLSEGYLGISNKDGATWTDRVLLSPVQVKALKAFLGVR